MTLSVDNSAKAFFNSGTAPAVTLTVSASAKLLVCCWDSANGGGAANLTACSANGNAMTLVPSSGVINALFSSQMWYLVNPPSGSVTITGTLAAPLGFQEIYGVSFLGADTTTPFGTAVTASSATGANSAVTATGAGSNDLYLGTSSNFATTITSGGSQTVLQSQPNAGGTVSSSMDTLPGSGSGAFTWTGGGTTGAGWTCVAVAVKAAASAATLIGSVPLSGPGVSPNKQTQFYTRNLSSIITATNVTVALTGQSATFATGSLTPSTSVALTGTSATFAAGTLSASVSMLGKSYVPGPGISPDYRQLFNSRNLSTFIASGSDVTVALTGQSAAFIAGLLAPSIDKALTGQQSIFTAGNLGGTDADALVGQSATFAAGILTPNVTVVLTGTSASFTAGQPIATPQLGLTGSSATYAAGQLAVSIDTALVGSQAVFSQGQMGVPGDVTVALTGQRAVFTGGTVTAGSPDNDIGGDPPRRRKTRNVIKDGKFVQEKVPSWPFEQSIDQQQPVVSTKPNVKQNVQINHDEAIVRAVVKLMFDLM